MSISVFLHHKTTYRYDRPVRLAPHVVRLRPAPHCRTPITAYSLKLRPEQHFLNWQQDPFGNYQARLVFLKETKTLEIEVDLCAEMTAVNPFDFFIDDSAAETPIAYDPQQKAELLPYLQTGSSGPRFDALVASV